MIRSSVVCLSLSYSAVCFILHMHTAKKKEAAFSVTTQLKSVTNTDLQ